MLLENIKHPSVAPVWFGARFQEKYYFVIFSPIHRSLYTTAVKKRGTTHTCGPVQVAIGPESSTYASSRRLRAGRRSSRKLLLLSSPPLHFPACMRACTASCSICVPNIANGIQQPVRTYDVTTEKSPTTGQARWCQYLLSNTRDRRAMASIIVPR